MTVVKQLEVQIMGQSYLLSCPEGGESRLLDAVEKVDTAMCKIRDAGKVKARDRIAVLAALNLAFDVPEQRVKAAPPAFQASSFANGNGHDVHDGGTDPRLSALMARLDGTLGGDGRLL
ncbi:MAG: cell division protein ZapA [Burkholderiaceae bacterium]|nr:cell division protein ZapA [Burkholderiaceae bacterium]